MGYSFTGKCSHGIFSIPHALVDSEAYGELSPAACKVLVFLYAAMNSRSAPCIRVSGNQLRRLKMDSKTIRAARRELESKNAIRCERAAKAGAPYELHVVNPETGEPFPPEDGRPKIADYKPRKSNACITTSQKIDSRIVRVACTPVSAWVSTKGEPPPRSTAAPLDAVSQERPWHCYICKGTDRWNLPDGAPCCSTCHPDPTGFKPDSSQASAPIVPTISTSTGAVSTMTEHGLPLKF